MLAAAGSVPTDAEIFMKAVGDLLTKRDPMRKAERAAARQRHRDDDRVGSYRSLLSGRRAFREQLATQV